MSALEDLMARIQAVHQAQGHNVELTLLLALLTAFTLMLVLFLQNYIPDKFKGWLITGSISLITSSWLIYALWFFIL
jgi:preprotein translocase subunit SecF